MRISLNWLKEFVEITLSPEELAKTLTIAGFEVEEIEDRRRLANGVVVGKVVSREPHPDADKLSHGDHGGPDIGYNQAADMSSWADMKAFLKEQFAKNSTM